MQQRPLRGTFVSVKVCVKKEERSQIDDVTSHFKRLEKEHTKPQPVRRKEITEIRTEINETETRKTMEKINKTELSFGKINKIHKPLTKLRNREDSNNTRNKRGHITTDITEMKRIMRD